MITLRFGRPLSTVTCLGAHPDDIEIGAAGTLLELAAANPDARFRFLVLTGSAERQEEARESARALLADRVEVTFGGFDENVLPYARPAGVKALLHDMGHAAETDVVLAPHRGDLHQDHRFLAEVALQVFRDHPIFGYEVPKYDGDLASPSMYVSLAPEHADAKLDHLDEHFPSQHDKPWYRRQVFAALLHLRGVEARAPSGSAEAFHVSKAVIG